MKLFGVKLSTYVDFDVENDDKGPNLNLLIMLEYQNIKTFLQKATCQIGWKKFLLLKKLKILYCGHTLKKILMVKKLLECFMKKSCKDKSIRV